MGREMGDHSDAVWLLPPVPGALETVKLKGVIATSLVGCVSSKPSFLPCLFPDHHFLLKCHTLAINLELEPFSVPWDSALLPLGRKLPRHITQGR